MTTGPTEVLGPQHYQDINGHWHHIVRQSDINRFRECPEKHRRHLLALEEDWQNDSAAIGQALHVFAQECLIHGDSDRARIAAHDDLRESYDNESLRTVQIFGGWDEAIADVFYLCDVWEREVWPRINKKDIIAIEQGFLEAVHQDSTRTISIQGTSDLWLPGDIWDWKTSVRSYSKDAWKHQRYGVQPIMYTWGRALQTGAEELTTFKYVVVHREPQGGKDKKRSTDELDVTPTWSDVAFLLHEIRSMCVLIEAGLPQWPIHPDDWHCSPKWCPSWDNCRGGYIGADPWGLMSAVADNVQKHQVRGFDASN